MRYALTYALLGAFAWLSPSLAQDDIYSNSYAGEAPPELTAPAENWLNSADALSLETLRGRVVYLEFSFLH